MGQKAHPRSLRVRIIQDWDSTWYGGRDYADLIMEDTVVRTYLEKELNRSGVTHIQILRKSKSAEVNVKVARPGIIFGRGSVDIKYLTQEIFKRTGRNYKLNIIEDKESDLSSKMIGEWIAQQLERRNPFRRVMKMSLQRAMKSGALGIKIACAGRLGGAEIARTEWYREGRVPLHTFRADIDYALTEANTQYGVIGIKVWICNGQFSR